MDERQEFLDLMERIRFQSRGAANVLIERYAHHVLRVIRRRLDRRLRTRFDSMDFSQEVWASFFAAPTDRFTFEEPNVLVAYLARMAEFKVIERFRQQLLTEKYNLSREHGFDSDAVRNAPQPSVPEAGPHDHAVAQEEWACLLEELTEREREIVTMLRDEYTHREIAEKLGINEKTVRRLIQRLTATPRP